MRLWVPGAFAGGAGAIVAVIVGVWAARGTSVLEARDRRRAQTGGIWLERGRLPRVLDLNDPLALGVHPAVSLDGSTRNRWPPFVPRAVGEDIRQALRRDRFVLLVGESTAGKSRAAYELVRAELKGHRIVQPASRNAALLAAELAGKVRRSVLWLDDLERYLGSDGLNGAAVREVLNASGGKRFIVATMRTEEYSRFSGRMAGGAEGMGREWQREGSDVLGLAALIELPRMWLPEEIARAREHNHDPRLLEAVRHANEYGVAEYLAAAPQLLAEWRHAWAPATHPRAAAMVQAAVDARRAGVRRPLSVSILVKLHKPYLEHRGGDRLRPEPVGAAVTWATSPLYATSSLLVPADEGFLCFDYLIDAAQKERVPAEVMDALIAFATPQEAVDVGEYAWQWSLISHAEAAFRRAEQGGEFDGAVRRCHMIREDQAGSAAALCFARDLAERTSRELGPDDPRTLEAHNLAAWETGIAGDPETARRLLEDLAARSEGVQGAGHKQTLEMRFGVAQMTGLAGDGVAAARQYQDLANCCSRQFGEHDEMTTDCRTQAGHWTCEAGDPARAATMFTAQLADMTVRSRSAADKVFTIHYQLARSLTEASDFEAALGEWAALVDAAITTHGQLSAKALDAREQHALCVGRAGEPLRAMQLLQALLDDTSDFAEPGLAWLYSIRSSLAWWTGEAGNPQQAADQFRALLSETVTRRGNDDPRVRELQRRLAHWEAVHSNRESTDMLEPQAIDIDETTNLVMLRMKIASLLYELAFPPPPDGLRAVSATIDVLHNRGLLDISQASALQDVFDISNQVAAGASVSPRVVAAVKSSGPAILEQLALLRTVVAARFEDHVLDTLTRSRPSTWAIEVDKSISPTKQAPPAPGISRPRSRHVDALVHDGNHVVAVEIRAHLQPGSNRRINAVKEWLETLPQDLPVLLIVPGEGLTSRELRRVRGDRKAAIELLVWDRDANSLIAALRSILHADAR